MGYKSDANNTNASISSAVIEQGVEDPAVGPDSSSRDSWFIEEVSISWWESSRVAQGSTAQVELSIGYLPIGTQSV